MSTYILSIDKNQQPKDLLDFLNKTKPQKGDKVKMVSKEDVTTVISFFALFALALAYYFNKKKEQDSSSKILQDIFKDYASVAEYEQHIEKEYGISLEVERNDSERADWIRLSLKNFERAYGDNEPDISGIIIKEPNPNYNPKL